MYEIKRIDNVVSEENLLCVMVPGHVYMKSKTFKVVNSARVYSFKITQIVGNGNTNLHTKSYANFCVHNFPLTLYRD